MILPAKQQLLNLEYFRSFDDEKLLLRLKEATNFWLRLLMTDSHPDFYSEHMQTLLFWQQNRDDLETIAKERNLIK
jgi:hypothetical protein